MDLKIPKFDSLDSGLENEVIDFLKRWDDNPSRIVTTIQAYIDPDKDYSVTQFKQDIVNWIASGFDAQFYRMHTKIFGLVMADVLPALKYSSSDRLYLEFIKSDESLSSYQYKHGDEIDGFKSDYVRWKEDSSPWLRFWTVNVNYPKLDVWSEDFEGKVFELVGHSDGQHVLNWFRNGFNIRYLNPLNKKYTLKQDFTDKILKKIYKVFEAHGISREHPIYKVIYSIAHVDAMRHEMDMYYKRGKAFDELQEYKRRRSRALSILYKVLIQKPIEG